MTTTKLQSNYNQIIQLLCIGTRLQTIIVRWQLLLILFICNCIEFSISNKISSVGAFEPDFVFPLENVTIAQGRDATFTCVVNNLGGHRVSGETTTARTATLEVVIPPDIIMEETSGDMMVPEGGSAKLVCRARGHPKPKITWRREDGREIIARNGAHQKTKALAVEGEMLTLSKVTRSEMGAYMCIASNGVPPSVSKRMKLQVHFYETSHRFEYGNYF
ncbi:lachesin-like [Teleopsis dalmanni]|uniref:lachesin-like n=1 Tax=Teleopsis dalmanni TaxID=139649 RepID=UPI0018CF5B74|nr:lachesin-like [Teleopsis dalmanni]